MSHASDGLTDRDPDVNESYWSAIDDFVLQINHMLRERWDAWTGNHEDQEVHEVIGSLLSRQVTLTTELARNFSIWNHHIAPLVLRPMVESLLTVAWILQDPRPRSKSFVLYGLGQEKLLLENEKAKISAEGVDPSEVEYINEWEQWLNSHRYTSLTEVNVGGCPGSSLRDMADEAGLLDLHRIDYARWSGATHNRWQYLVRFNLAGCPNPLHGFHRLPGRPEFSLEPNYLQLAVEYLDRTFVVFDEKTGVEVEGPTGLEVLDRALQQIPFPESGKGQGTV